MKKEKIISWNWKNLWKQLLIAFVFYGIIGGIIFLITWLTR